MPAVPMLAVTPNDNAAITSHSCCARSSISSGYQMSAITNSSPPERQMSAVSSVVSRSARATETSASSPVLCP